MKKQLTGILAAAAFCAAVAPLSVSADAPSANITVSIANAGEAVVKTEAITVTDADNDGALTINDALILTHDKFYEGGAEAGYGAAESTWGLSLTKLWGNENGGSYGYTVNNTFAMGLTDAVADGDYLYAYAYKDAAGYSDQYTFFDKLTEADLTQGDTLTLTLNGISYDANWQAVTAPVSDAVISINGAATEFKTDAEGKVTITLADAGDVFISAASDEKILVPAMFRATVAAAENTAPAETTTTTTTTSTTITTTTTTTTTTTAAAPATGDRTATAIAVTGLLALGAAFALRRHDK